MQHTHSSNKTGTTILAVDFDQDTLHAYGVEMSVQTLHSSLAHADAKESMLGRPCWDEMVSRQKCPLHAWLGEGSVSRGTCLAGGVIERDRLQMAEPTVLRTSREDSLGCADQSTVALSAVVGKSAPSHWQHHPQPAGAHPDSVDRPSNPILICFVCRAVSLSAEQSSLRVL